MLPICNGEQMEEFDIFKLNNALDLLKSSLFIKFLVHCAQCLLGSQQKFQKW